MKIVVDDMFEGSLEQFSDTFFSCHGLTWEEAKWQILDWAQRNDFTVHFYETMTYLN